MDYGLVPVAATLLAIAGALAALQYRFGRYAVPFEAPRWTTFARRPVDRGLLAVHEALARALPGHVVLIDVPLERVVRVADADASRAWRRQVRDLAVHAVVCDPAGDVIGAIELFGTGILGEAEHAQRRAKERILESAGIRVIRLRDGRLPDDARLRELLVPAPAPAATERRRPQWLRVVK